MIPHPPATIEAIIASPLCPSADRAGWQRTLGDIRGWPTAPLPAPTRPRRTTSPGDPAGRQSTTARAQTTTSERGGHISAPGAPGEEYCRCGNGTDHGLGCPGLRERHVRVRYDGEVIADGEYLGVDDQERIGVRTTYRGALTGILRQRDVWLITKGRRGQDLDLTVKFP